MATSRLLFRPLVSQTLQNSGSCSSYARKSSPNSSRSSDSSIRNANGETSFTRANILAGSKNTFLATKAVVSTPVSVTAQGLDVISLWENVVGLLSSFFIRIANWKLNPLQTQGLIERVIIDCRFFTLLAVAGSLIGSVLCFVEGLAIVMKSYYQYFAKALYKLSVVELLIEAIDMFLVGTAMLIFGMGIYVMFVRSKNTNNHKSSAVGHFYLEALPSWLKMESVSEAKTRIGHAVLMILQVGMVEKFKSVPLVTGSDLAFFAGAVLFSSASIFCLSKLSSSEVQG